MNGQWIGRIRAVALIRAAVTVVLAFWLASAAAAQDDVMAVTGGAVSDLLPHFKLLETDKPTVTVEIAGQAAPMTLEAKGGGPVYRWALVTLINAQDAPLELVIVIPHRGLVGSGVFWPSSPGSPLVGFSESPGVDLAPLYAPGQDAFAVTLAPGTRPNIAFELGAPRLDAAELWTRAAYDSQTGARAFFRGANLGVALLTALAMVGFLALKRSMVFPAAAFFAFAGVAFLALEAGYLPLPSSGFQGAETARIAAVVESLMLAGLLLVIYTLADLRRNLPQAAMPVLGAVAVPIVLAALGWFEPAIASGLARILFAIAAIAGFAVAVFLWRGGVARSENGLIVFGAILLWSFICAVAVLSPSSEGAFRPLIAWGLAAVLLTLSFVLAQTAFAQGYSTNRLFEDAGRRALALAGAQQHVWDWHVEDQDLYVSEELERDLGLAEGTLSGGDLAWLEQIHPSDRPAYLAAIDAAERRGRGAFSLEFRLRRGDDAYRWFVLRARAIPGHDRRASRCIGTLTDITEHKRTEERLLSDAVYDRVTGLPNKALFMDRLTRAIASVDEGGAADLYVLQIDIDRFKTVNDGLGHEVGDSLLTVIGRRLSALVGTEDTVARLPGDQFAILFAGSAPKRDIIPFADSVRAAVARPVSLKPQEIFLTACIGVASYRMRGQGAESLLKDAAIALYEAKRRGKDTVEFFRTTMRDDRTELVALEAELRRAIERSEIEVFYQPIARLYDMDLAGFEALVRWRHPTLGLLGPESFLGLAEQTGIIRDIGVYVLGEAARQLGVWQRAFRPREPVFCAVNISSSQLIGPSLVDEVKLILGREGIKRETLKIEVTESIVMQNPELARGVLDQLKQLGVGLACDDFGTGYSSLSNLRRLPFDTLKVDRSFISPDPGDDRAAVILDAIVAMARRLGLTVVAEGIETQRQVDRLTALGCDLGQGYFIGQPMSAKQIADALTGLPYTGGRGRAVMAALWERAMQPEPPPVAAPPAASRHVPAPPAPRIVEPPPRAVEPLAPDGFPDEGLELPEDVELPPIRPVETRRPAATPSRPLVQDDLPNFDPLPEPPAEDKPVVAKADAKPVAPKPRPAPSDDAWPPPFPSRPKLGTAPMAPRFAKLMEELARPVQMPPPPPPEPLEALDRPAELQAEEEKPKPRRKTPSKSKKKKTARKSPPPDQA